MSEFRDSMKVKRFERLRSGRKEGKVMRDNSYFLSPERLRKILELPKKDGEEQER